jgi:hypothetical protein
MGFSVLYLKQNFKRFISSFVKEYGINYLLLHKVRFLYNIDPSFDCKVH